MLLLNPCRALFLCTILVRRFSGGYTYLPAAGNLSGNFSIETQIVVQRKWLVIFKNLTFTPKKLLYITIYQTYYTFSADLD